MSHKRTAPYIRTSNGSFARRMNPWMVNCWSDGQINHKGYFIVYRPDYPRAWKNGYAPRYHVVWWLTTGQVPPEDIHHNDGNKLNDVFANLESKSHADHTRDHFTLPPIKRLCTGCHQSFVFKRRDKDPSRGKYCSQSCYHATPRSGRHVLNISRGLKLAYAEGRR